MLNATFPVLLRIPLRPTEQAFVWGSLDSSVFVKVINDAYVEVVHWRKNFFSIPHGQCGKSFVSELTRSFTAFAESYFLESIALKTVTVLCVLVLQRPHPRAKSREHISCLTHQLELWRDVQIEELLSESHSIQQRLYSFKRNPLKETESKLACTFTNFMFQGKMQATIRLLPEEDWGVIMQLKEVFSDGRTVLEILQSKHSSLQLCSVESLVCPDLDPPVMHPVVYEAIDAQCIRVAALHV